MISYNTYRLLFYRANSFNNSLTVNNSSIDTETATSVCLILSLSITVKTSAVKRSESRLSQLCAENDFCIFLASDLDFVPFW